MLNLRHEALSTSEAARLSAVYATEIAASLGIQVLDVTDVDGRVGRVSFLHADDPVASTTGRHFDMPPPETSAATTTVATTTAAAIMTTTAATRAATTTPPKVLPPLWPMQGIAYGALPCQSQTCGGRGLPSRDMAQAGYAAQWGSEGRGDLRVMAGLGANAVRMYHTLGLGAKQDHGAFLDEAQSLGLNVIPGYHTEMVNEEDKCVDFDCFDAWKEATLKGFDVGFKVGGAWHPAVAVLVLLNEPDFFDNFPKCSSRGAQCRVKAVISALDGVLAAEREAGVDPGRVVLTATWSFASRTSIDGLVTGPGVFGFQDVVAAVADPSIANYTPRTASSGLREAFAKRWAHGLNTQSPWDFVDEIISKDYARFEPTPWFIGEYGANGQPASVIESDLQSMRRTASRGVGFKGAGIFQFQTAYEKGGSEMNFGLFSLGEEISKTGEVCDDAAPCAVWPVRCLDVELPWLEGTAGDRAAAVAAAWGGAVPRDSPGACKTRPSTSTTEGFSSPGLPTTTTAAATRATTARRSGSHGPAMPGGRGPGGQPSAMPPLSPMRGIAYGALPCKAHSCGGHGLPSEDMEQQAYEAQWGIEGRDDLGAMRSVGANAVRMYHSMGLKVDSDHGAFLDRAAALGLNLLPGYHTQSADDPDECPGYDCFDTWRAATLYALDRGFRRGSGWHPAVAMLILLNEPDFFEHAPKCQPSGAWCRVKAVISALDGVLDAERAAGLSAERVKLSVAWSFAVKKSIDGKVEGPGVFGFQDVVAVVADPSLAGYQPRSSREQLQEAFRTRWVHGLNTQAQWGFVNEVISRDYARFEPTPWFIGEYGANGQPKSVIRADLEGMQLAAEAAGSSFAGAVMFEFQTSYWKGGSEKNFGLFSLGEDEVGRTGEVCDASNLLCRSWPVYCLDTRLGYLQGDVALRAQAVVEAWGGAMPTGRGMCGSARRLAPSSSTRLACRLHVGANMDRDSVDARLNTASFGADLVRRTLMVIGLDSAAISGPMSLSVSGVAAEGGRSDDDAITIPQEEPQALPLWCWVVFGVIGGLIVVACVAVAVCRCMRRRAAAKMSKAHLGAQPSQV